MFTRQAQQLHESLWQGGLSAAQAHAVANALGQCRAPLVHRGPITYDYSTPEMKLIEPNDVKLQFPSIQAPPPEEGPPVVPNPIERPPEEETPDPYFPLPPPAPITPIYTNPNYPAFPLFPIEPITIQPILPVPPNDDGMGDSCDSVDGEYIYVDANGCTINLETRNDGRGKHCVFGDNEIVGKSFEAKNVTQAGSGADVEPTWTLSLSDDNAGGGPQVWTLESPNMEMVTDYIKDVAQGNPDVQTNVVTGINFDGTSLSYTYRKAYVLQLNEEQTQSIETTTCE